MSQEKPRHLVWLICINYNSDTETQEFVKAFTNLAGAEQLRIAIVDNSEREDSSQALKGLVRENGSVQLLRPGKNLGYFGGAAWGLETLLEKETLPDWVAVSNTDIKPVGDDFLQALVHISSKRPAAVVAPAITASPSGLEQNPYMRKRPSRTRMSRNAFIFRRPFLYGLYETLFFLKRQLLTRFSKRAPMDSVPTESCAIYAPHGACIFFHKSYFENGGGLDFGSFLFGEEIFVAETARVLGLQVSFEPMLRLTHQEHSTTGLLNYKRKARFSSESADYLLHTFFSRNGM